MCTLLAVLAIWHISMVRKNKTDFKASLKTYVTLSKILNLKLDNPNPSHTDQALSLKTPKKNISNLDYNPVSVLLVNGC